ncbi:MAG TPA: hypothetical protein VND19_05610 [Acetobacteraceae bacterium]|nr:hypothetical protein [Acetobacteraceae bacterium]
MTYLPPFNTIRAKVHVADVQGRLQVNVSHDEFLDLVRAMLSVIEVDEAWYLEKYPDVAEGIKAGKVASARQHFMHNGYFEGRLPFAITVDERWYLTENPGVADYIRAGRLGSGQQHFDHDGYREGRLPFPL